MVFSLFERENSLYIVFERKNSLFFVFQSKNHLFAFLSFKIHLFSFFKPKNNLFSVLIRKILYVRLSFSLFEPSKFLLYHIFEPLNFLFITFLNLKIHTLFNFLNVAKCQSFFKRQNSFFHFLNVVKPLSRLLNVVVKPLFFGFRTSPNHSDDTCCGMNSKIGLKCTKEKQVQNRRINKRD